jgi:outer membrane protein TolC
MTLRRVLLAVLFCGFARGSGAQTPTPLSLTLDDAIRRGLDTSHRLAETIAHGQAASAIADQSHAAMLPVVAALGGYNRTNHVDQFGVFMPPNQFLIIYPDIPNNYHSRLDLQWTIYSAGRLDALERAARTEASAWSDEVEAARNDLRLEITRAYWALATAGEAIRVVDQSVVSVGGHLQEVRDQFAAGIVPPNDVLTVEAQESRERMLAIQARTAREVAEADVARLTGIPLGTTIQPAEPFELPAAIGRTAEQLLQSAMGERAERRALTKRAQAADERARAAASGKKPNVSIAGGFDYARPNPRIFPRLGEWRESWDASVNVGWLLFDGGKTRAAVAEAEANARAVRERMADFDQTLAAEIRQRLSEIVASRAAVAAADDAIRSATEARRVVGNRFAAGVATSTDVVDAQVRLLQSELDRTQAIANARLAEARLDRALGR